MDYFAEGSPDTVIEERRAAALLEAMVSALGPMRRVLLMPPDHTRLHSWAGVLTTMLYKRLAKSADVAVLPALGTHAPMTLNQRRTMFPGIPDNAFFVHAWRTDLARLGEVPASFVRDISERWVDFPIPCEVNRLLVDEPWDRIISIGQLVPHEVAGIANHAKNIFVGAGGQETINKTHFLGAVCGMERVMGRADTPVRRVLNYMSDHFGGKLPIVYLLTVRGADAEGTLVTRGMFAGDDRNCFDAGARLCRRVNVDLLDVPVSKCVVHLDARAFRSTWLGNKAIYRTRMAIADGGELVVLAPGVKRFGEDEEIDRLIRRYGYRGTADTLQAVAEHPDLSANLSAAAHLIHGSSEGRFRITYAAGGIERDQLDAVGFCGANLNSLLRRYDPASMRDGYNTMPDGEGVFYVSNPSMGLWALRSKLDQ